MDRSPEEKAAQATHAAGKTPGLAGSQAVWSGVWLQVVQGWRQSKWD